MFAVNEVRFDSILQDMDPIIRPLCDTVIMYISDVVPFENTNTMLRKSIYEYTLSMCKPVKLWSGTDFKVAA